MTDSGLVVSPIKSIYPSNQFTFYEVYHSCLVKRNRNSMGPGAGNRILHSNGINYD